ncbi:MAG: hypothetical protein RL339_2129 [Pseudomonadota bacterium]|jgi:hypothetical protein
MNSDRGKWLALLLFAAPPLAACVHDGAGTGTPASSYGEANRQTMLAQVIEPDNQYEEAVPPTNAGKAAQAVERYRKDAVKKPERVRSTSVTSSTTS